MSRAVSAQSPSFRSHSRRSTLELLRMSMDGEFVTVNRSPGSYTPVFTNRASTSFTFEATTNLRIGAPSFFA